MLLSFSALQGDSARQIRCTLLLRFIWGLRLGVMLVLAHGGMCLAESDSAFAVFANAVRGSGLNPATISSGSLVFSVVVDPIPESEEEFRFGVKSFVKTRQNLLSTVNDSKIRNEILEQIADAEVLYLRERKASAIHERHQMLFVGVEPYTYVLDEVTFPDTPSRPKIYSVGNNGGEKQESFYLKRQGSRKTLDLFPRDHCYPVNRCGRLQGEAALMTGVLFSMGSRQKSIGQFEFNFDAEILRQAEDINSKIVAQDSESGIRLLREENIKLSDSALSKSVVIQKGATAGAKGLSMPKIIAWIAPDHNLICPRIEIYETNKLSIVHESSDYFVDEDSGLFWPSIHKESRFDLSSGKLKYMRVIRFDPDNVDLNIPIGEENFKISIQKGEIVEDRRNKLGEGFVARENLEFIPRAGKFELKVGEKFDKLITTDLSSDAKKPTVHRSKAILWLGVCAAILVTVLFGAWFFGTKR